MIYNNSILDGFPVVLGSMPTQLGLALTMFLCIVVPKHPDTGEKDADAARIYNYLIVLHFTILLLKILNEHLVFDYPMLFRGLMICALFFQLLIMNFVLGDWVYSQEDPESLDSIRGDNWNEQQEWVTFMMWLSIETYVFLGSLVSGVIYMFVRAFIPQAHILGLADDVFTEKTDHLEANNIAMEMFEAYFVPLFASLILVNSDAYQTTDDI